MATYQVGTSAWRGEGTNVFLGPRLSTYAGAAQQANNPVFPKEDESFVARQAAKTQVSTMVWTAVVGVFVWYLFRTQRFGRLGLRSRR